MVAAEEQDFFVKITRNDKGGFNVAYKGNFLTIQDALIYALKAYTEKLKHGNYYIDRDAEREAKEKVK